LVVLMGIHENMPYAYWRNICNTVGITDVSYVLGDIMNSKDLDFHANYEIQPNDLIDCLDTLGITL